MSASARISVSRLTTTTRSSSPREASAGSSRSSGSVASVPMTAKLPSLSSKRSGQSAPELEPRAPGAHRCGARSSKGPVLHVRGFVPAERYGFPLRPGRPYGRGHPPVSARAGGGTGIGRGPGGRRGAHHPPLVRVGLVQLLDEGVGHPPGHRLLGGLLQRRPLGPGRVPVLAEERALEELAQIRVQLLAGQQPRQIHAEEVRVPGVGVEERTALLRRNGLVVGVDHRGEGRIVDRPGRQVPVHALLMRERAAPSREFLQLQTSLLESYGVAAASRGGQRQGGDDSRTERGGAPLPGVRPLRDHVNPRFTRPSPVVACGGG